MPQFSARAIRKLRKDHRKLKGRDETGEHRHKGVIVGGVKFRQGKLDSDLKVKSTGTVSIWKNSSTGSYVVDVNETDGEDTGDNWKDCSSPSYQSSTIAHGTFVGVLEIGGERVIIGAACPT